ncbi:hypothetical protein K2173_027695 [Erythroxylum novogranatense]|uniref:Uncharacterized protein n=1 Tax=Erythroxylum novogranatense TaxID=1862640 RepID=A0AAV8U3P0_9ROSI|nr:hypothetical protein K2173_027695 [Erythroxylum novogranatense]
MATTRMLRSSRPLRQVLLPTTASSTVAKVKCVAMAGLVGERVVSGEDNSKRKPTVAVKAVSVVASASLTVADKEAAQRIDLVSLLAALSGGLVRILRPALKGKPRKFQAQRFIERVIANCRFFTMFAVAGTLLGSLLCFVEGCFLISDSYFHYFDYFSRSSHRVHIINALIEAIDMFLIGIALFMFGVGLYVMFVASKDSHGKGPWLPGSNLCGLFYLKQSLGLYVHAVMMILQVGLLEKFKNIPLANCLDFACFAGAVLVSSACIFILSKLSIGGIV